MIETDGVRPSGAALEKVAGEGHKRGELLAGT